MSEHDGVTKLPKLTGAEDYINWRQRLKAYIQRNDIELFGLSNRPESENTREQTRWRNAMFKAKSEITLTLADGPMAQVSAIVDDDNRTAKDLWDALDRIYRMSNSQMVINIERELEKLTFIKDTEWESHIEKFHRLVGKLASYDKPITEEEKASKLIRSLPERFSPIAMVAESSNMPFERIVASVKAEISRRQDKEQVESKTTQPIGSASMASNKNESGKSVRLINKHKNVWCRVCGKQGHYSDKCWYRHGGSRGRGSRGRYRGRGRGGHHRQFHQHQNQHNNFQHNPYGNFHGQNRNGQWSSAPHPRRDDDTPNLPNGNSQSSQAHANYQDYNRSEGGPRSSDAGFQGGFMAKIKFRTTVANVIEKKNPNGLIDSGATHHFFFAKEIIFNL